MPTILGTKTIVNRDGGQVYPVTTDESVFIANNSHEASSTDLRTALSNKLDLPHGEKDHIMVFGGDGSSIEDSGYTIDDISGGGGTKFCTFTFPNLKLEPDSLAHVKKAISSGPFKPVLVVSSGGETNWNDSWKYAHSWHFSITPTVPGIGISWPAVIAISGINYTIAYHWADGTTPGDTALTPGVTYEISLVALNGSPSDNNGKLHLYGCCIEYPELT